MHLRGKDNDGGPPMELGLLDHLLTLANPADGAELLHRLIDDLKRVATAIEAAALADDRKSLGANLHVLIGISGSIGADQLMAFARALGEVAKEAKPLPPALLAQVAGGLVSLLGEVGRRRQAGGAAS